MSWNLFLIKLQSLRPVTLIKKRLKDRCCSSKIRKFYRKTPALESVFNKTAGPKVYNFIKKRLQLRFLPVKFVKFLKTSFFTEQFQWLLLSTESHLNYIFTKFKYRSRIEEWIKSLKFFYFEYADCAFLYGILNKLYFYLNSGIRSSWETTYFNINEYFLI